MVMLLILLLLCVLLCVCNYYCTYYYHLYYYYNYYLCVISNPRCAHARSEGYCSCPVCMCVCVHSYLLPHTLESHNKRYQWVHSNTAIVLNFANFPKNASFKSYGVICLPRAPPASYSFSPQEICFYASFEAYSYVFTAQTTGLWKTACDSLAQTRETAQIYGSRILTAPPTSAYTQANIIRCIIHN